MNSLLSEFSFNARLRTWLEGRWAGLLVAALFAGWVVVAIVLARLANADCIKFVFLISSQNKTETILVGYWAELNHALFHLLASLFVVERSFWLLRKANDAFRELSLGDAPNVYSTTGSVPEIIEKWNKKIFRWTLPAAIILGTATVFINECKTYDARHIGWVQTGFLNDWKQSVNKQGTNIVFELPEKVRNLASTNSVTLAAVETAHPVRTNHSSYLYPFLFFALVHQVAVYSFGIWIAGKIIFLIIVLAIGMRTLDRETTSSASPLLVSLTFDDEKKRFGFSLLDPVYDTAAMLVLSASIGVVLMFNNSSKDFGTYFSQETWGRVLPMAIIGLLILVLLFLPILIFGSYADSARAGEYKRLTEAIDAEEEEEKRDKLRKKRDLLQEQRAWPAKDAIFWSLVGLSFVTVVLFPLGMNNVGPDWFHESIQWIMESLPKLLCNCN